MVSIFTNNPLTLLSAYVVLIYSNYSIYLCNLMVKGKMSSRCLVLVVALAGIRRAYYRQNFFLINSGRETVGKKEGHSYCLCF